MESTDSNQTNKTARLIRLNCRRSVTISTRSRRLSTPKRWKLHHDKHHQAYVDNLNKALAEHVDLHGKTLAELLAQS
jgi:hypothetical protein